tara:strand:- start:775 stop:1575 length:801 start_codon:yes stop_codon:yes gene_type:complete
MKIYFITYGDKSFKYSKSHLCTLAKHSGFFDKILSLGPENLNNDFKKNYREILNEKKGGGYWVWKHEIINNLLNEINKEDIILYCDAGSSINNLPKAKLRFKEYLDIIGDKNTDFLRFETEKQFLENQYTSRELFDVFNIDVNSKIATTTQLQAGVMFFKKNDTNMNFFQDYKKVLNSDKNLITDFYNKNQFETFIGNRHDQSIFSLLGKTYNSYILENETEFRNRKELQYDFPILTVRASNHGLRDKFKFTFLMSVNGKKTRYFT